MKNVRYEVNETEIEVCDGSVLSYGISCIEKGMEIVSVKDISTDRKAVERLAKTCNNLDLAPSQLEEVAEDFVS